MAQPYPPADYAWGEASPLQPQNKHSTAYATSLVVKTGPGVLYGFTVFNSKASTQYILLIDINTVPADGDTTLAIPFPVATLTTLAVSYGTLGRAFNVGCVLVNSSTANSKTVGSADCWFDAQYL